jgi:hypothetical protein
MSPSPTPCSHILPTTQHGGLSSMPSLLPSSSTSNNNRVLREVGQTCPYHPQCLLNDTVPIRTHVRSLRGEEHIFNLSLLSDKRCWTMWKQKNVRSSGDYWSVNEPPSCSMVRMCIHAEASAPQLAWPVQICQAVRRGCPVHHTAPSTSTERTAMACAPPHITVIQNSLISSINIFNILR